MPFNRRGILAGLLGTPLGITALKAHPLETRVAPEVVIPPEIEKAIVNAPPLPTPKRPMHPFFGFQKIDGELGHAYLLRTKHFDDPHADANSPYDQKLSIQIVKDVVGGEHYATLDEVEDLVLGKLAISHRAVDGPGVGRPDQEDHTKFHLIRATNLIARTTRRGAGNTLLVHRDDLHRIDLPYTTTNVIPQRIGRWTNVASAMNTTIQIWVTDKRVKAVPENHALVLYRGVGEMDAAAILSYHEGFGYSWALNDDPSRYVHKVGLTLEARYPYTNEAIWKEEMAAVAA